MKQENKELPFIDILSQKRIDVMKIIFMIGLILTMIVVGVVIFKYGSIINANPCDFCNCGDIRNIGW